MVPDNATDAWLYLIVDKKIVGAIEYGINGNRIIKTTLINFFEYSKNCSYNFSFFKARYGNRTRLLGLGSRCITDILTVQYNDLDFQHSDEKSDTLTK